MTVLVVQFSVQPQSVVEIESALETMCAALEDADTPGVRFAAYKLADGLSFLNVLQLERETPNPLPRPEAAREFQQLMTARATREKAPEVTTATVVGSYRLF